MLLKTGRLRKGVSQRYFSTVSSKEPSFINDINTNPLIKSLFGKERIAETNKRIYFELSHSSRRESMMVNQLKDKLGFNKVNSLFKDSKIVELDGVTQRTNYLLNKTDLKDRGSLIQSFDYNTYLTSDLKELQSMDVIEFKKNEDKLLTNRVLTDYDYIENMNEVERELLKEEEFELKENEVKLVNIPVQYSIKDIKNELGLSSKQIIDLKRDYFGQIAELKLSFESEEQLKEFLERNQNRQVRNSLIQLITKDSLKNECRSRRTIVIDNLNEDITKDELILAIAQDSKIKGVYFPELLDNTPLQETSDIIKQIKTNSFTDKLSLKIKEFNGESFKTYNIRSNNNDKETESQEEELFDINSEKIKNIDFLNQFTKDDFIELKKNSSKKLMKQVLKELNQITTISIKDSEKLSSQVNQSDYEKNLFNFWNKVNQMDKVQKLNQIINKTRTASMKVLSMQNSNNNNSFGKTKNMGFAVVEFYSVHETKKAMVAIKSNECFSDAKINLLKPNSLFKYQRDLKKSILSQINEKQEKRQRNLQDILEQLNKHRNSESSSSLPKIDEIDAEAVKFLKYKELKDLLSNSIDNFVSKNYYSNSKNLEDILPSLTEIKEFMSQKGRMIDESTFDDLTLFKLRYKLAYQKGHLNDIVKEKALFVLGLEAVS